MYVTIDLESGSVGLAQPENFGQFHVALSGGGTDDCLRVLGGDGAATDQPDHVWVSIAAVRRWARGQVGPDWEAGFEKMLDYADSAGWLDSDRTHIQAHLETEGS